MKTLQGKWNYRSFCPRAGAANSNATIAAPWAPPAVLTADTDASGKITGTLQFAPTVKLTVKGTITPAAENLPEGIEITAEGLSSTNLVRGYYITDECIAGCVLALAGDLAKQPPGTLGAFILTKE